MSRYEEILSAYRRGLGPTQIAEELDVSRSYVYLVLAKARENPSGSALVSVADARGDVDEPTIVAMIERALKDAGVSGVVEVGVREIEREPWAE